MADNIQVSQGSGTVMATDDVGGVQYPRVKISFGADGAAVDASSSNPLPVTGPITDAQLRAAPVSISGDVDTGLAQPLTNDQLRSSAIQVSGTVNTGLSQPLTDTQLRAAPVPVSGSVNTGLIQPLTDQELRSAPISVSGTVSTGLSQPLTDAQLRASALPVSVNVSKDSGNVDANTQRVTLAANDIAVTELMSIDNKLPNLVNGSQPNLIRIEQTDGTIANAKATENGAIGVGNAMKKFRDGFVVGAPDSTVWDQAWTSQGTSFVERGGNAAGSAYLKISLDPTTRGSEYELTTKTLFKFPSRYIFGVSASQRILGQELEISMVGTDDSGNIENGAPIADMPISGAVSILSNIATINFATAHPFRGGDRVILKNNANPILNVGPVVVTVVSTTQITVPLVAANGGYTAGGVIEWADPFKRANNAIGILLENANAANASWAARRNGASARLLPAQTIATTNAVQSNTSPFTDAFNSAAQHELYASMQEMLLVSRSADSFSAPSSQLRFTQGIPDEEKNYKLRIRAKNLNNLSRPVAKITAIAKTGTVTATVTTDVAHNLTTSDVVQIYGVRDQTNFPNLASALPVASIISATQFSIAIGSASTTSSFGGGVWKVEGGVLAPGIISSSVQSVSRANNVLNILGHASFSTLLPGETIHLYGCTATSMGLYDGPYKVLRASGTSLEVESVGPAFSGINCGGAVIKRTDYRIHFVQELEHTRHVVELSNQHGSVDSSRALPTTVTNTPAVTVSSGTINTVSAVSTVSAVTSANLGAPSLVTDGFSTAIGATSVLFAANPTFGSAYSVNIPVTAVSGTSQFLDVSIEESDDSGTNWFKVYDFPRITAVGMYRSPILRMRGNRIRYVQTVGGASPSFTRSINRLQISHAGSQIVQMIDRTINPTVLGSASPVLNVEGCQNFYLTIRCVAQTNAALMALQFSHDGANWFSGSQISTVTGISAGSFINNQWKFARVAVTAAGTGITFGEATITAVGI